MANNQRRLTFEEVCEIILARSIPEPNSGCFLWEGGAFVQRHRLLYGGIRLNGKMVKTHRVIYEATHGPIPFGLQVLHSCDVGLCCNPDHLFLGTNDDNHADKARKDRGKQRLTHEKAIEAHKMRALGLSQHAIARDLGVNQSNISRMLSGIRRPLALAAATQE